MNDPPFSPLPVGVLLIVVSLNWLFIFPRIFPNASPLEAALCGCVFMLGVLGGVFFLGVWAARRRGLS